MPIMGTDDKKAGGDGEKKPIIKQEKKHQVGRDNRRRQQEIAAKVPKDKKFEGACPDLIGHVFVVLDHLKTYVGQKFDSKVQESMETMTDVNYVEPQPEGTVTRDAEGNETLVMNRAEEIKYGKMYDRYLADQARLEKEKKQMFAIVYGQMDDEVRAAGN